MESSCTKSPQVRPPFTECSHFCHHESFGVEYSFIPCHLGYTKFLRLFPPLLCTVCYFSLPWEVMGGVVIRFLTPPSSSFLPLWRYCFYCCCCCCCLWWPPAPHWRCPLLLLFFLKDFPLALTSRKGDPTPGSDKKSYSFPLFYFCTWLDSQRSPIS